jgi:hypothetical protein
MMGPVIALSSPVPVRITAGKSCYDIIKGLAINENETLLVFYNRLVVHRKPWSELEISYRLDGIHVKNTITQQEHVIRLCRTLRVPENGNVHDIPATFGPLPHIDISECSDIPEMKKKGGLMVPMLQREALCITFTVWDSKSCQIAVRVYAGGVNTITGLRSTEPSGRQDYYVSPLQNRVDGFGGGDGQHVKQFVAMPVGSGYSVEKQLSGAELGGIQFQIAPGMKSGVKFEQLGCGDSDTLDLTKTPRELGLRASQCMRFTEEPGTHKFWKWESAETGGTDSIDEFHEWAFWTKPEPKYPTTSTLRRSDSDSITPYPSSARPALLSDLFNEADLEPQGGLVVSAVAPIQITIRHPAQVYHSKAAFTSMYVSPFESAAVFENRILFATDFDSRIKNAQWKPFKDESINDYVPIHSIGICDGYVIETAIDEFLHDQFLGGQWDMSFGSGVELMQNVKKDPIPEYWNWEASQFVNVQMLNTVAFESVTGLAAPATPISFQEYTKAGIPSLSFYPDAEMLGAVVGKFPVVRTIGNIDSLLGVKYAVRLDPNGKPGGCVICERSICNSVYGSFALETDSQAKPVPPCLL